MPYALTARLAGGIMEILGQKKKKKKKHRTEQMGSMKEKIHWETVQPVRDEEKEKLSDSLYVMWTAVVEAGNKLRVS